jgi:hypothetical protein
MVKNGIQLCYIYRHKNACCILHNKNVHRAFALQTHNRGNNKMKSCTVCTSFTLQSPKADEYMMVMAGLLTYSFLAAFPPVTSRKWHVEPGIAYVSWNLQLRDSSGFTPDSLLILYANGIQ